MDKTNGKTKQNAGTLILLAFVVMGSVLCITVIIEKIMAI